VLVALSCQTFEGSDKDICINSTGTCFGSYFDACSGLNTARHAGLNRGCSRFMQATMRSTLGISELQRRNTSPVQALRSSEVPSAKLAVGKDIAQMAIPTTAMPLLKLASELAC